MSTLDLKRNIPSKMFDPIFYQQAKYLYIKMKHLDTADTYIKGTVLLKKPFKFKTSVKKKSNVSYLPGIWYPFPVIFQFLFVYLNDCMYLNTVSSGIALIGPDVSGGIYMFNQPVLIDKYQPFASSDVPYASQAGTWTLCCAIKHCWPTAAGLVARSSAVAGHPGE